MTERVEASEANSWGKPDDPEALQQFRTLVATVNAGVYQVDADQRFVAVDDALLELTGYAREDLLGEHVSVMFSEADTERLDEALATDDRSIEPYEVELSVRTAESGPIPCEVRVGPLTDDGELRGALGVVTDVSERHRYRDRDRKLEQYRALTEAANDVIVTIDEDSTIRTINPAVEDVFGYEPDELVGESLTALMPDDLVDRHYEGVTRYLETGDRTLDWDYVRLPGIRADGSEIPLAISFSEIEYADEQFFTGIVRDITEHKKREQALQESKNQLRALIDVLPVAVFVAEADGEIVEWNEAAEEIWGGEVAASESIDEYDRYEAWWVDTGEPVEPEEWPLARALQGEEVTDPDEIRIKGFDGEYRTVLNHGMPVRDADGEVSRAVVTLVDITERREYQRKLEESNERLEQFAYAASHDLQEPLRMVSSYLQLFEQRYGDELDADGEEFLEFAVDGAERMKAMIDGLLEYSRVETQGNPLEPVDLQRVVDEVLVDLQFKIEEKDAEITVDDLPRVTGDASQLRQVFQNLLDNALEYSGSEPPRIDISAQRHERDSKSDGRAVSDPLRHDGAAENNDAEWVISISDNGIGIDPDDAERVFDVFQRLHSRDEHPGTGIGLALCERILERHGGEIWVDSEPGEGSTFSFTLPATDT